MLKKSLERYAELIVRTAVNIKPGQVLWINAPIHSPELVRLITVKAYEAGAKQVQIEWQDEISTQIRYKHAPEKSFEEYPAWRVAAMNELVDKGGAFLHIESGNPELLKGIDPKRISAASKAAGAVLTKWQEAMTTYRHVWSIIAVPSPAWAKKVFPELAVAVGVEALWEEILKASRADLENPVEAWREHNGQLEAKREQLTAKQYRKLRYRGPGTDLTVVLPEHHVWRGGAAADPEGHAFNPNIPTEEVFTSPRKEGTAGTVASTRPLSYQGNLIRNFTLRFEEGRVVECSAEEGEESLKALLALDPGSAYLGEVALVPDRSPISQSGLTFYNTLFDENASCHLALGQSFATCLEGGADLTREQRQLAGLNESIAHVDFMIGGPGLDIDGETPDGEWEPVFRAGNWAF